MTPRDLATRWREDAERLAAYGDDRVAGVIRRLAGDLEAALRDVDDEPLTLAQAARESGYSPDRLRHMVAAGQVPNAGRKGSPRLRRGDLPKKAAIVTAFDAHAAARRITQANTAA